MKCLTAAALLVLALTACGGSAATVPAATQPTIAPPKPSISTPEFTPTPVTSAKPSATAPAKHSQFGNLPIPADAQPAPAIAGGETYVTAEPSMAVLAFEQTALAADGWKLDPSSDPDGKKPGLGGTRTLNVCKSAQLYSLLITADTDPKGFTATGKTSIVIPQIPPDKC